MRIAVVLLLALVSSVAPVAADPVTIGPDGTPLFHVRLTTEAAFGCRQSLPCTAGSNSITFGSGANTTTVTFTGVDTSIAIGTTSRPVSLGQLSLTTTGSGFQFPDTINPNTGVLNMGLVLNHEGAIEGSRTRGWRFINRGENLDMFLGLPYVVYNLPANPGHFNYTMAVYSIRGIPFRLSPNGAPFELVADVGAIPEPGTILLVGSGIAAGLLRRRRRLGRPDPPTA
jgi:hypothetical protein